MRPEFSAELSELDSTLTTIEKVLNPQEMSDRVRELEAQAADPSLWDDPDHAQQVTSELSHVQAELRKITDLRQRIEDLPIMVELAEEEDGDTSIAEEELADLRSMIDALEVKTMVG